MENLKSKQKTFAINEDENYLKEHSIKSAKGITLIALVVTIVVLLILAGVTITMVLGEGGILDMAKEAAEKTNQAIANEQGDVENLVGDIQNILGGSSTKEPQIRDNLNEVISNDKNTIVYDEFNNPVTIPAGFQIVKNGEYGVEYKYSKTNPGTPTVQDGIVIKDGDENQFVWIPLETDEEKIKDRLDDNHKDDAPIKLGRYKFDVIRNENSGPTGTGKAELKQSAEEYNEDASDEIYKNHRIYFNNDNTQDYYYYESTTGNGNTPAKNLEEFINDATKNRGYYLARYEAGQENGKLVSKSGKVYNNVTQSVAAKAAQEMYTNDNYTSDLINSYAWDTAIVFIQKYSDNKTYSKQNSRNSGSSPSTTGEGDDRKDSIDKVCNIYDMASNCLEWTTETSTHPNWHCSFRGCNYTVSTDFTAFRFSRGSSSTSNEGSFRSVLYVKPTH